MAEASQDLFEAVRRACSAQIWSRGIELSRAESVVGESADDDEIVCRVVLRGGMYSPRVVLYPDDPDWDCECDSRDRTCEHVAASVIAWHQAGRSLPETTRRAGRVGYRLSRVDGKLGLARVVVHGTEEQPLETSLSAVAERRVDGPRFVARPEDLALEVALGAHRRGPLPRPMLDRVLPLLARCDDLTMDGVPFEISEEPSLPHVRVEDSGDAFLLRLLPDPRVSERFANGAVRCGRTLHPIGDPRLSARERDELTRGRVIPADAAADLVTEILPRLRERVPLDVDASRLPQQTAHEPPRIAIRVSRNAHDLTVLPTIVYGDPVRARVDGGRLEHFGGAVPLRDRDEERRLVRRLAEHDLQPGVRMERSGPAAVTFRARLGSLGAEIQGDGLDHFRLAAPIEPAVVAEQDRFDVRFESFVEEDDTAASPRRSARSASPEDVLRAWREGASLVPLVGGGWAPLPVDWLSRYGRRIADLLAARDACGALPACVLPDLSRLCEDLDLPTPPDAGALRRLAETFEGIPRVEPPADLRTTLRDYQQTGLDWLSFLREAGMGALLADDMGLGKTLQALCALRPPALVVAPTSVLHNWAQEAATHRPELRVCIYHGAKRELDPDADLTLTTYAILRLDVDRLSSFAWSTVILDEAQNIKNPQSRVAAAAYDLEAPFKIALTGTPVENRLEELWSQFHFTNRGLLGGLKDFQTLYVEPISRGEAQVAADLRRRIRPFLLRRLKSEVARELPPRTDMVLECELDQDERATYDAVRAATYRDVVERLGEGGNVLAALEALLRLRQAACHRSLIPGQRADHSSKLRVLIESLESVVAEGHKALVFSQWTSLLDLTEPHLDASGLEFVRLDGTTRDRAGVVNRFQQDGSIGVLLASLKAGGVGLNLTAADHIFLLDPWWNPAVEDQAADRAHRIGQERPVMVYRLVALDTVEQRILDLQQRKREIANAALGEGGGAAGLTRDDLLGLLA